MATPWFVWALWVQRSPLFEDRRVELESPGPLRRPAVGSSGTQPATAGARTSARDGSPPQAISRSYPHCSLRRHDRAELWLRDLVRQPVLGEFMSISRAVSKWLLFARHMFGMVKLKSSEREW